MLSERAFNQGSLCVVGNINRDLKTAPLPAGEYLFRDGEISVPYLAETIGGGGANSAFAAATLGAGVTFIGRLGADALGDRLERTLKQHGIASHVARGESQPSGTSLALTFENGHRHFISCLPSCRALTLKDIDLTAMTTRNHLLRADVWFSETMLHGGNLRLFKAARKAGMDVSLDLNWDPHWDRASRSEIKARKLAVREALPWVNLIHGNVRELTEFADAADLKTALVRLTEWGAEAVTVHLGGKGAGYYDGDEFVVEPPAKAKRQVNATGTGDVLSVCMILLHRQERAPIRDRLRLANKIVAQFIEGKRQFIPTLVD
jgi:sugar/nucleoside kinase (ribokinase family)